MPETATYTHPTLMADDTLYRPRKLSNGDRLFFHRLEDWRFVRMEIADRTGKGPGKLQLPDHLAGTWTTVNAALAAANEWLKPQGITISEITPKPLFSEDQKFVTEYKLHLDQPSNVPPNPYECFKERMDKAWEEGD